MPSSAEHMPTRIWRQLLVRTPRMGACSVSPASIRASNSGDSLSLLRIQREMASSGRAATNGMRQPQASKLLWPTRARIPKKPPEDRIVQIGEPICGSAAYRARLATGAFSTAIITAPLHSPPTASPCRMRRATRMAGAGTDGHVVRQHADQAGDDADPDDGDHQDLLASDLVAQGAEDEAADRPGDETHRQGREGAHGRDERVLRHEVLGVEHQRGRGGEQEEVVPLQCGAHQGRECDLLSHALVDNAGRLRVQLRGGVACHDFSNSAEGMESAVRPECWRLSVTALTRFLSIILPAQFTQITSSASRKSVPRM